LNPDWDIEFLNPASIINLNDRYLILNDFRPDNFFHVFSLPGVKYLYSWGKQGRGPDEFLQNPVYIDKNEDELIVFDGMLQTLRYFSVNDTTLIKSREVSLAYEGQVEPLNRIRRIHDTLYAVDYGSSIQEETNHEHMALEPGEEIPLFTFGEYPNTNLEGFDRYSEFLKTNIAKPDGSRFAAFYIAHNMFKIYNSGGDLLALIEVTDPYLQNVPKNDERYLYRSTAWASDDYIYLLGLNAEREIIYGDSESPIKTSLEIWDWDGRPVYRAMFDRRIDSFTVSEKHGKIVGFSKMAGGETMLLEYDLTDVLNKIE
jgi:hypothetical protein